LASKCAAASHPGALPQAGSGRVSIGRAASGLSRRHLRLDRLGHRHGGGADGEVLWSRRPDFCPREGRDSLVHGGGRPGRCRTAPPPSAGGGRMTVPPDFLEAGWADDANGLAELDRTRALCAAYASPECLPPDIEAEACEAFRKLAAHLECGARTGWIG